MKSNMVQGLGREEVARLREEMRDMMEERKKVAVAKDKKKKKDPQSPLIKVETDITTLHDTEDTNKAIHQLIAVLEQKKKEAEEWIEPIEGPTPRCWSGSPGDLVNWIARMRLHMALQGSCLQDRRKRVLFAASYLKGTPFDWVAIWLFLPGEQQPKWLENEDLFFSELLKRFGRGRH